MRWLRGSEAYERELQQQLFAQMASRYDATHQAEDEHGRALAWLASCIVFYGWGSYLEVGAGTGRHLAALLERCPKVHGVGIEPVEALRQESHAHGLAPEQLIAGNGYTLDFPDEAIDVVAAFATLHHVREPARVVGEMLRVARKAIFLSDSNNFGCGSVGMRWLKILARAVHVWPLVDWMKTSGKGYTISEGDALAYSYSVFSNLADIRAACPGGVYLLNTVPLDGDGRPNLLRCASHIALLGLK